ncbi:MAG TPA: HAMP domain-containing sensor histidine kinase [Nitrososphaeraceae archaeon]
MLHATVSLLNMNDILFLKYFIPQTWFAGRIFLSAMLAIAIVRYTSFLPVKSSTQQHISSENNNGNYKLSILFLFYLVIVTLFSSVVTISSLFVIFPYSVIDYIPVHRPYELVPLALFLISLYYFYKNKIYKNKDIFYTSLVVSIIYNIFGQLIMSYSAQSFDTAHNFANVLKDTGYFINIIGLALSTIQYNVRLRESNELITIQYEKVKEAEKINDKFINIAAPELRTPIQPILMLTDIIYYKIKDETQRELLEIFLRNVKRLKRLSDNLLDITKIESRSLNINKKFFNLNILISEVLKGYVNKQKNKVKVELVYYFKHKTDIFFEADRDRISQVIRNLLDNALKITIHSNQTVFVIVDKKEIEGQIIVSVKDTGEGISNETLSKLFTKFTTSDSTTGTGLGLYICKNIVEAHGGRIWAENNSNENGAIFTFTLPTAK